MRVRSLLGKWRPVLAVLVPAAAIGGGLVVGAFISGPATTEARLETLDRVRVGSWYEAGQIRLQVESLYMCTSSLGEPYVCLDIKMTNLGTKPIDATTIYHPESEVAGNLVTLGYAHGTPADSDPPTWVDLEGYEFLFDSSVNPGVTEAVTLKWDLFGDDISEFIGSPERIFLYASTLEDVPGHAEGPYWSMPDPVAIVVLPLEGPR